jgi:hypothetical protein
MGELVKWTSTSQILRHPCAPPPHRHRHDLSGSLKRRRSFSILKMSAAHNEKVLRQADWLDFRAARCCRATARNDRAVFWLSPDRSA